MAEPDVSALLTVAQAIAVLDAAKVTPRTVTVPLAHAAGLRLVEDLRADRDYPPFDKSLMDGSAVRCADLAALASGAGHVDLRIAGEIAAGSSASAPLLAGQAFAIMTGAPIPDGADGVVPVEDTEKVGGAAGAIVRIRRAYMPARYIARRGSDLPAESPVLSRGELLGPAQIAAAATIGATTVQCFARPRVAVLSTGDEVVEAGAAPGAAQIRNANSPMLVALLNRLGCDVTDLGNARDEPETIRAAISRGLAFDALFVTGGMSMGAYDFVPKILAEFYSLRITKLRIKPGKPFVFATRRDESGRPGCAFGLPGNPVSAYVCTVRLASRVLQRMAGGPVVERWTSATLAAQLAANGPREFYQPVRLEVTPAQTVAHPLGWKGSADLFTLARAGGLLVRSENEAALEAGAMVRVMEVP